MRRIRTARWLVIGIALILATACSNKNEDKARRLAQGDKFAQEGKASEALVEYGAAVRLDDRDAQARTKLGRAYLRLGDVARAMQHLVRAADLSPADDALQLEAARVLLTAGRFEDSRTRAESVIKRDPKNADAYIVRATATAGLKDVDSAITSLEDAIRLDPSSADASVRLATLEAAEGRYAEAEAGFKQALSVNPQSVGARLALVNYYALTGRQKEATDTLVEGVNAAPSNIQLNRALAALYLNSRRAKDAEAPLKRLAEVSNDPQARLTLADYYIAQKRQGEALEILKALTQDAKAKTPARVRLAALEYEGGHRAEAYKLIDALLAEQPQNAQLRVVKGTWLANERKFDAAMTEAEAAVAADAKSADAQLLLGSVAVARHDVERANKAYTEALRLRPGSAQARVAIAELTAARGKVSESIELARQAITRDPTSGNARLVLARGLLAQGNAEEAERTLQPLLEAAPNLAPVLTLSGQIHRKAGRLAEAQKAFSRALENDPRSVEALTGLVNLELGQKRRDAAIAAVNAQVAKAPDSAGLQLIAGRTFAVTGDLARSEAALRKAIELDPSLLEAYHVLGQVFVRAKKLDQAVRAYQDRLAERPSDVPALTMIGMIQIVQGKLNEARSNFEKVLSIDPRAPVAANNLAYMDAEAGTNLDVALNRAQTAKAALPDEADVNDTLGWIYVKRGLPALAIAPLEQAIEKNPSNPLYHFHAGTAYARSGDKERSRAALQRALQLSSSFEGAQTARDLLNSLAR